MCFMRGDCIFPHHGNARLSIIVVHHVYFFSVWWRNHRSCKHTRTRTRFRSTWLFFLPAAEKRMIIQQLIRFHWSEYVHSPCVGLATPHTPRWNRGNPSASSCHTFRKKNKNKTRRGGQMDARESEALTAVPFPFYVQGTDPRHRSGCRHTSPLPNCYSWCLTPEEGGQLIITAII